MRHALSPSRVLAPASAPVLALGALLAGCAHPSPGAPQAASTVLPPPAPAPAAVVDAAPAPRAAAPKDAASSADTASSAGSPKDTKDQIEIVFPSGGTSLTAEAKGKLDHAARLFREANPVLMFTSGHADTTGDEYANLLLSARRAAVVKRALVARGIPADRLLLQAFGSSQPADSADPAGATNRRVVVTWRLL